MKAGIVSRDETEEGERALLNLGHTFCHALEKATGYSDRLLHGEGVAIGCALAFELSSRLGLCAGRPQPRPRASAGDGDEGGLRRHPGDLPGAEALIALMGQDKKVVDGKLRFILARGIGQAFVADDVPGDAVRAVLDDALRPRTAACRRCRWYPRPARPAGGARPDDESALHPRPIGADRVDLAVVHARDRRDLAAHLAAGLLPGQRHALLVFDTVRGVSDDQVPVQRPASGRRKARSPEVPVVFFAVAWITSVGSSSAMGPCSG
jgi:hypothetical protein